MPRTYHRVAPRGSHTDSYLFQSGAEWVWGHERKVFMNEPGHTYRKFIQEVGTTFRISAAFGVRILVNWRSLPPSDRHISGTGCGK
jgi:hypothetical protein